MEKVVLDAVKNINIEHAAHSAPVDSLAQILALKNVTGLRKLGKALHVKYYGKLHKPELIPAIVETMKQANTLRNCLYT